MVLDHMRVKAAPHPEVATTSSSYIEKSTEIFLTKSISSVGYSKPKRPFHPQQLRALKETSPTSNVANGTNNPDFEINWDGENDQMNPRNWATWYKGLIIAVVSWGTWVVVVYSTSYTTGLSEMMHDFNMNSEPVVTLGVTTYLVGLAIGSVILAPVSEMYGRRPVYIGSMFVFMILFIP